MSLIREAVMDEKKAVSFIKEKAHKLKDKNDLQPLFDLIGDSRLVLLGEASHGTHEYYAWRSLITRRLIEEKGFQFVAVEGDWPDCYQLNRYCKNYPLSARSAVDVLKQFNRWPTWMWANWEVAAFAEWLAGYNKSKPQQGKAGFYGLDVYSLWESMEAIMQYLKRVDPQALKAAENAFHCFEPYQYDEGRSYARATQFVPELCKDEVVELLRNIQERMPQYNTDHENVFNVQQNAFITLNAERYYRAMIRGGAHSWNIRDSHMSDTLERLLQFHGAGTKAVIWAHNTHVGDARATDMTHEGMFNLGELVRMKHHEKGVVIVGFGSYHGEVIAGNNWGATMQRMQVPEARKGSWEYFLHAAGSENKLLLMNDFYDLSFMEHHLDHRAIGVVYHPAYEQYGNYVPSLLPMRYDAFIYFDRSHALHPMHIEPDGHQIPGTYPFGF
jgi:erythromycin esterase